MNATIELKDCNFVIVANNFNLSIINTVWLFKNQIFTEDELQGSTNLPVMVQLQSEYFQMLLTPDRLQFSVNPDTEGQKDLIKTKIGKLINTLPHTPFVAAGINFTFFITPKDKNIHSLSRSLFFNEQSNLFKDIETDTDDARFGGYFSKDLIGTRFRLDAKPIKVNIPDKGIEAVQFSYNFNIDLSPSDGSEKIFELIEKWDDAKRIAQTITEKTNSKD